MPILMYTLLNVVWQGVDQLLPGEGDIPGVAQCRRGERIFRSEESYGVRAALPHCRRDRTVRATR